MKCYCAGIILAESLVAPVVLTRSRFMRMLFHHSVVQACEKLNSDTHVYPKSRLHNVAFLSVSTKFCADKLPLDIIRQITGGFPGGLCRVILFRFDCDLDFLSRQALQARGHAQTNACGHSTGPRTAGLTAPTYICKNVINAKLSPDESPEHVYWTAAAASRK
jgi:hypothetical protein